MRRYYIVLLLAAVAVYGQIQMANIRQQPKFQRTMGMGYGMRWFFHDISGFSPVVLTGEKGPNIDNYPRLHGIMLYGRMQPTIIMGMSAWGNSFESENDAGKTEWFGMMAGIFLEGRKDRIIMDWYGTAGFQVSWGYFGFSGTSENTDYTPNIRTSAMLLEPTLGLGYDFSGILELRVTGAYVSTKFETTSQNIPLEYDGPKPFDDSWTLSTSIRYNIPAMIE